MKNMKLSTKLIGGFVIVAVIAATHRRRGILVPECGENRPG